ncbi:MAG: adenosylhomocysteinase [Candidatus Paceibacterota bacterium]|jgi:adenosylhomocysteinase
MKCDIKDIHIADKGRLRIQWAAQDMPVLNLLKGRYGAYKPLKDINIAACMHVTTETANLVETLKIAGANVVLCASNPLSTQDDVAASIVRDMEIPVYAIRGENSDIYYRHIFDALESEPHITMDDGADLLTTLHKDFDLSKVLGGTEETTTGVIRLRAMEEEDALKYPVIAVNDADTKHLFDNRYGTGQSTIDGIIRATNRLLAGSIFVVCGYGWCGKGIAMRAKGLGARVIITEIDPIKALEAVMDGFEVMTIREASRIGDFFCTVTGNINVIDMGEFSNMKNGAMVANSGHFNVELNLEALEKMTKFKRVIRDNNVEYTLKTGIKINILGEGRLINLASAEGHPSAVMDMSFANQVMAAIYLVNNHHTLMKKVYRMPIELDKEIAKLKLDAMEIDIDELTEEQEHYLNNWEHGT